MSLNTTPAAERIHIGIFGKRNAGKSSLINAVTSQDLAIVSEQKGTTTDPVYKAMELLPLGPVMIIDTPGIDDEGDLGQLRIEKAYQVLNKCDIVLLVVDAQTGITKEDKELWAKVQEKNLPGIVVLNKVDLLSEMQQAMLTVAAMQLTKHCYLVSAETGFNIKGLKEAIAALKPKETELAQALLKLVEPPRLVVTDSQAFAKVAQIVPPNVPLTSFSILMARYKGSLENAVRAVRTLDTIQDGDKILISEGCTHHRQCQDIGTVKMPGWIRQYTRAEPEFCFTSGGEFPADLSEYKLVVHCGGCMLNEKEMLHRNKVALAQGVPMTNYGIAIAYMHGILQRTVSPLPDIAKLLE